jgi:VWFA-related protein
MRRFLASALAFLLIAPSIRADGERPVDKGLREHVEVNLAIVDVQVLDAKGHAVPGLAANDFELVVDHRVRPIVSFDVSCGESAHSSGASSAESPALVLAFDYQHLNGIQRGAALESARRAIAAAGPDGEVMVAALTGGLRVEQPFTSDVARVPAALRKMQYDVSLFAGNFSHLTEDGFVRGLTALFDVAATLPKPKAVLFFSAMGDVPLDSQFKDLAAKASASRSVVYPIDVRGLDTELIGQKPIDFVPETAPG